MKEEKFMKKRTLLQEYLYLYGDSTCLSLINLNYKDQFFFSMETVKSKLSAKYCETLIKRGITKLKKLDLSNKIMDAKKHGTNLIYRNLNSAIEELGESLVLDMLNHNLRYRFENDIPIFKLTQTSVDDLEKAKSNWTQIKINKSYNRRFEKEKRERPEFLSFSAREETPREKKERENQEECGRRQREREAIERNKKRDEEENKSFPSGSVKRSLDADPDDDLSPEIFELSTLNEKKLKNIDVKHNKDEEKYNE
jgi:hypothetical protein